MSDDFQIPVTYKGKHILLDAILVTYGYSYKIEVEINSQKFIFEPDEEKNFRCMIVDNPESKQQNADYELLETIALSLKDILS